MKTRVVQWFMVAVLVATCGAAGAFFARLEFPDAERKAEVVPSPSQESREQHSPESDLPPRETAVVDEDYNDTEIAPTSTQAIIDRFKQILAVEDSDTRRYQSEVLFDGMMAEQAAEVYAALNQLPANRTQAKLMESFFERWGFVDGPTALKTALQLSGRRRADLSGTALLGWARVDPKTAWTEAKELAKGWWTFEGRIGPIIAELARVDLAAALTADDDVPTRPGRNVLRRAVADVALRRGTVDALLAGIAELDSIEAQQAWAREVFIALGRAKPDAALAGLSNLSNAAVVESAMSGFLTAWSSVDRDGALKYALDHHDDPAVSGHLPGLLLRTFYRRDRKSTLELIDRVVALDKFEVLGSSMIPGIASNHPEIAAELAQTFSDERQRVRAMSAAMRSWVKSEFEPALAYYEALPATEFKLQALQDIAAATVVRADGGAIIVRLVAAVPEDDRVKAVERVLIAAGNPRLEASAESLRTLQQLAGETKGLSDEAQALVIRLFGDASISGGRP